MLARLLTWTLIVGVLFLAIAAYAQSTQCQDEPNNPTQRWWWRMIDGRKCWYVGERMRDKSLLYWPKEEVPASTVTEPPTNEFDDRWNALNDTPYAHNAVPVQDWRMW